MKLSWWVCALTAFTLAPMASAQGLSEHAAVAREPYADAPGVTPIHEPLRTTAEAIEHYVERAVHLSGFLRTRGDLGYDWDLNRGAQPTSGQPIWPVPYIDNGRSRLQTNLDMRLRVDVDVDVGWGVSLHTRIHALDNLQYGSTPQGTFVGATVNQVSPPNPVDLRQAYGSVLLPFGILSAGRMGAPVDWGTGFFVNSGNGIDDDYGDVGDRIMFTTPLAGLLWSALYEISASGPSTAALRPDITPAFDLDPRDDVRTAAFAVARWDTPASHARLLRSGRTNVNFGLLASYRTQTYDIAPGTSPAQRNAIHRDLGAFVGDLWVRADVGPVTLEAEMAYLGFSIGNASLDPAVAIATAVTGQQIGGVVRADLRATPRFFARMEFGFASGDPAPGFGARNIDTPAQPGDLDGNRLDLTATPPRTTINNFRFSPNYHVDMILWRRIIGTITNAWYVRPMARYRLGPMFTVEGAVIGSVAMQPNGTPSGRSPLGVETDVGIVYEQEHGFVARLDYGLLVPLAGFRNVPLNIDPSLAHAVHLLLAFRY